MLGDIRRQLQRMLSQLEVECQSMSTKTSGFDSFVNSYLTRLSHKLLLLAFFIVWEAASLYEQHKNQGYICVIFAKGRGFSMHWIERKEIVTGSDWSDTPGYSASFFWEVTRTLIQLKEEVDAGNWVRAVDWWSEHRVV